MESLRDEGAPRVGRYVIDPSGSRVSFATTHLFGTLPVHGTFAVSGGTVEVAEEVTASSVRAEVAAGSIDTRNAQRDAMVRSSRYLDAERYPTMVFAAERVEGRNVVGSLTVHGVTRPVTLAVEPVEIGERSFSARATVRVDRTEFGVTAGRGMTGRHLDVVIEVVCVRT